MKKVSMATIAKQLNVSTVTVHKAFKNQGGVSPALRQRILDLASELGYERPPQDAAALNFVHLIQKDFLLSTSEQYYTVIYYYLNQECSKIGAKLHFIVHDTLPATLANFKSLQQETPIDGVFISGQIDKSLLAEMEKLGKPVVCIDFFSSDFPFNYVYVDNYYAGYTLTKYLIQRGHRRICFVGDIKFSNAIADRYFGYLRALNRFDIAESMHINCNIERSFSEPEFDFKNTPTAFVCHCDRAASVLYMYLEKLGYRIPEDISVTGFDNTDICQVISPRLTSFGIDKEILAFQAFQLMEQSLHKKRKNDLNYVKLNLNLYERDSVADAAPPPSAE